MTLKPVTNKFLDKNTKAAPVRAKKKENQSKIRDKVTIGGAAKKAAKFAVGTTGAVLLAPTKALLEGMYASVSSALEASGLEDFGNDDDFFKDMILITVPAMGITGALWLGAGPLGAVAAGFMMPGALGGAGSAVAGAVDGATQGIHVAENVGKKAEKKISGKLGKIAGKAAEILTSVAVGAVATPVLAVVGGLSRGLNFAEKAIGVKKNPESASEVGANILKEAPVLYGYLKGAMGTSCASLMVVGAGAGAGAAATGVKGAIAAGKGLLDGAKQGHKMGEKLIENIDSKIN